MSEFLLVHGTGHGAWCWRDVIPELARLGHHARAIDLPCHGADHAPIGDASLTSYADAILDALEAPTIIVGHSMGGFPITQAACLKPDNIRHLIYLCAYVPTPDTSLVEMRKAWPEQPLAKAFDVAANRQSFRFKRELIQDRLYHDCSEVLEFARARLCDEPMAPSMTAITGQHTAPSSYIRCTKDRAIPPAYQAQMAQNCGATYDLNTGHSPFFADPAGLAGLLDKISAGLT